MTTPAKLKYTIYQGTTTPIRLTWMGWPYDVDLKDGVAYRRSDGRVAPDSDRVPVDLTGSHVYIPIRSKIDDPTVLMMLSTENGKLTNGGASGVISGEITDEESAAISWGSSAVARCDVSHSDGRVTPIAFMTFTISKGLRFA